MRLGYEDLIRYSRQIRLGEVGISGQKKLLDSSVLVVGVGGLGSVVSIYLAASGVGRIGVVDGDVVELSNLQRQVVHTTQNLGKNKVESAREKLEEINPDVEVETHKTFICKENADIIVKGYDMVVEASDNLETKYLVNDVVVAMGKPLSLGSVQRFQGQVTTFDARQGPCYRCLFPNPPKPGAIPTCEETGVFGPLVGIIGSIQAAETIKKILGVGASLEGRLLVLDSLKMVFTQTRIVKNPGCPTCGGIGTKID